MLMPVQTYRVHVPWDDLRCDTVALLNLAAREGRRFVDCNACVSADLTAWNLHWAEGPKLNHYTWIWTGKRTRFGREIRRPMTAEELDRNVGKWTDAQIARWRRAATGGPRPATVAKRQLQAKWRHVYICWELKARRFGEADVAERIVEDVNRSGWPAFYMALVTMPGWGPKAKAIHQAGGQFALLAHNAPRPANFDQWRPYITRIWGSFR